MKQSVFLFVFIFLGLIIIGVFAVFIINETPNKKNLNEINITKPIIYANDPVLGNPMAKISLIEFGDFKCSACQKVAPILKEILSAYPNQVQLIWKGVPGHNGSENALLAGYCAQEQGKFWEYHDLLFLDQDQLDQENIYLKLAQSINLDLKKFDYCLNNNQTFFDLMQKNIAQAQELKVNATPYFFVGKEKFSGAISFEEFKMIIENQIRQ